MKRLRIGSGSAWWGDRIEPARLNAEQGDLDYLCFETMAEATISAAQVRKRRDPDLSRLRHLSRRPHERGAAGLHQARHQDHLQPGLDQSGGRGQRVIHWLRELGARRASRSPPCRAALITDSVLDLTDTLWRTGGRPRRSKDSHRLGRSLYGGRTDRRRRCARAPRSSSRAASPTRRIFMAPMMHEFGWDPLDHASARARQRHRPPDGMRRAGDRRLFLRSGLQGRARAVEPRASRSPRSRATAPP